MTIDSETNRAFDDGLRGEAKAPGLYSSTLWEAWEIGHHLRRTYAGAQFFLVGRQGAVFTVQGADNGGRLSYRIKYGTPIKGRPQWLVWAV